MFFLIAFLKVLGLAGIDEGRLDAELPQVDVQQRVRAAVERGGRDDVVARAAQREDGGDLRRLAGGGGERRAAALDRRHALLEHRHRRVGDARVDVAEGLQVEQARRVLGRVEHERGGLVDRRGARAGGRIRDLPGVQAKRLDAEFAVSHGDSTGAGSLLGSVSGQASGARARGGAAVLGGRDADLVQEEAGEVALRGEAELGRHLGDLALPGGQARDRGLDAQHVEVGARREAGAQLEQVVEARARQADLARQLVDAEVLVRAARAAARSRGGCGCPRSASRATAARRRACARGRSRRSRASAPAA